MFLFDIKSQRRPSFIPNPKGAIREAVDGPFALFPYMGKEEDELFVAYGHSEGMSIQLPHNYLAWGVMRHLDFLSDMPAYHFGNVVLTAAKGKVTERHVLALNSALRAYWTEMEEKFTEGDFFTLRELYPSKKRKLSI